MCGNSGPSDLLLQRLVRFLARDGRTYYGDAILPAGVSDIAKTGQARVIKGDIFGKHDVTDQIAVEPPISYLFKQTSDLPNL